MKMMFCILFNEIETCTRTWKYRHINHTTSFRPYIYIVSRSRDM